MEIEEVIEEFLDWADDTDVDLEALFTDREYRVEVIERFADYITRRS